MCAEKHIELSFAFVDLVLAQGLAKELRSSGAKVYLDFDDTSKKSKPLDPPGLFIPFLRREYEDSVGLCEALIAASQSQVPVQPLLVDLEYQPKNLISLCCSQHNYIEASKARNLGTTNCIYDIKRISLKVLDRIDEMGLRSNNKTPSPRVRRSSKRTSLENVDISAEKHQYIAENAESIWTNCTDWSDAVYVEPLEQDSGHWFLCLECDLEMQLLGGEIPDSKRTSHEKAISKVITKIFELTRPFDVSLCRIFEGHGSDVFLCFKSPLGVIEALDLHVASLMQLLGSCVRAVLPYDIYRDLLFSAREMDPEFIPEPKCRYRVLLSCLHGNPVRISVDIDRHITVEQVTALALEKFYLSEVGVMLFVWDGGLFRRISAGNLDSQWKYGTPEFTENGESVLELPILVEPKDSEKTEPQLYSIEVTESNTDTEPTILWQYVAVLIDLLHFSVVGISRNGAVGFQLAGNQEHIHQLENYVNEGGLDDLLAISVSLQPVSLVKLDECCQSKMIERWIKATDESGSEQDDNLDTSFFSRSNHASLRGESVRGDKFKNARKIIRRQIRQIESNLGVVRPASETSSAFGGLQRESSLMRKRFILKGAQSLAKDARTNAQEKKKTLKLAELIWKWKSKSMDRDPQAAKSNTLANPRMLKKRMSSVSSSALISKVDSLPSRPSRLITSKTSEYTSRESDPGMRLSEERQSDSRMNLFEEYEMAVITRKFQSLQAAYREATGNAVLALPKQYVMDDMKGELEDKEISIVFEGFESKDTINLSSFQELASRVLKENIHTDSKA
eukprot:m.27627 g.27627  ORF g.27627 m.27627 type:complete len:792 (+) comp7913_c0_seq1:256-2631(+)